MTNFYKQVFVSPDQNVSAGDINLLSAFDCQNNKNFNKCILNLNDCILSGLQVIAPPAGGSTVTVRSGYALYASPTATTTIQYSNPSLTLSYQGSIVELDSSVGISVTTPDPTNIRYDAIDLIYTEYQAVTATRNFIDPGTGVVSSESVNTQTVSNTVNNPGSPNTNIVYTQGTPGAGFPAIPTNCIRLAIIQVNPSGGGIYNILQSNITQSGSTGTSGTGGTLPRIFDLQSFPTNSNAVNGAAINTSDQSNSLADSLSSMRYQLNQIITTGNGSWYAQVPISLPQLLIWAGTDTGSSNVYSVSISNFPTSLTAGLRILFIASNPNTAASTISVNGGTAVAIKNALGQDIDASSIQSGQRVLLFYDGTYWVMPYLGVGVSTQSPFEIPNGSFEIWNGTTPQAWTTPVLTGNAVVSQDTSNSIDGSSALKINIPSGDVGTATTTSSLIPCSQQNTYYIKFKCYWSGIINASVSVNFYDSGENLISSSNLWSVSGSAPLSQNTYYGIVLPYNAGSYSVPTNVLAPQMPNNTRYLSVTITGGISSVAGSPTNIWFDGLQFFYPGRSSVIWTSSAFGTYTLVTPGNCIIADVTLVGAGAGGGGSTTSSQQHSGGGGGQGGEIKATIPVFPDTQYTVVVGQAGSGGVHNPGNPGFPGTDGGNSYFKLGSTILLQANGGTHGGPGGNPEIGTAGSGGSWSFSGNTNLILSAYTGGNGGAGSVGGSGNEADGGNGGNISIHGNPYLITSGGTQKSQDHGGAATSPSGSGAGGAGGADGDDNTDGQGGIDGSATIEF